MSKELKIKGALTKDFQQIYVDDEPINLFINSEGEIRTASIKNDRDGSLEISSSDKDIVFRPNANVRFKSGAAYFHRNDGSAPDEYLSISHDGNESTIQSSDGNDLVLNAGDGQKIEFQEGASLGLRHDAADHTTKFTKDANNYFQITVGTSAATTLSTLDAGVGVVGHLTIQPDGDLILDPVSQKVIINATDGLYLDGGGDTYIYEASADAVRYVVGGDILMTMSEYGAYGNNVEFRDASVGFRRDEASEGDSDVIGGSGDTTDIDFRTSNKYRLEMTADIGTMNLIFPSASGNFLLVCTTDGDHDVSYWKVFEADESAATTADVMWAGGSVPAFTSSGVDIVSFYWDANEQQAYGTASLAFATP